MIEVLERPLVTLMQLGFNQEEYIRESVEAAFAQTYSPLEIILSDNASTDRTFEIMRSLADRYKGPHKILINQNAANRGVSHNVNRVLEMASGELIVYNAGDDISFPTRVSRIVECWEAGGREAFSIYSNCTVISADGKILEPYRNNPAGEHSRSIAEAVQRKCVNIPGCVHVYRRSLFHKYGPLPANYMWDDEPFSFRSLLEGKITYIHEPLLFYRLHTSNLSYNTGRYASMAHYRTARLHMVLGWIEVMDSWISDMRKWEGEQDEEVRADVNNWVAELENHKLRLKGEVVLLERAFPAGLLYALKSIATGVNARQVGQNLARAWMQPYLRSRILRPFRTKAN